MTRMVSGIYKITNQLNHKVYVGQSQNVYLRQNQHFIALRRGYHENDDMQKDWNKDNRGFRFDVIEFCPVSQLNNKEQYWITQLNTMEPNGYNKNWVPYKRKKKDGKRKVVGYHRTVKSVR